MDEFYIVSAPVGRIRTVELCARQMDAGGTPWYVDYAEVDCTDFHDKNSKVKPANPKSIRFPAYRCLVSDKGTAEGVTRLVLTPGSSEVVEYELIVHTSQTFGADTDGDVFVTLVGSDASATERNLQLLDSKPHRAQRFQCGYVDSFKLKTFPIGKPRQLVVRLANDRGDGWILDKIELVVPTVDDQGAEVSAYDFCAFTTLDKANPSLCLDAMPRDVRIYRIIVFTGWIQGAGTDANVTVELKGTQGSSMRRLQRGPQVRVHSICSSSRLCSMFMYDMPRSSHGCGSPTLGVVFDESRVS
jgi:hypothetical protein